MKNDKTAAKDKKITDRIGIIALSLSGLLAAYQLINRYYVDTNGEYLLAKKIGVGPVGKSGASSRYVYMFSRKKYSFSITDNGGGEDYIFVKIIPDNPGNEAVQPRLSVPECLQNDSLLGRTWKKIPTCK